MNFLRHYFNFMYIYYIYICIKYKLYILPLTDKWYNTALLWEFILNGALATAETWHVKGRMLKINLYSY